MKSVIEMTTERLEDLATLAEKYPDINKSLFTTSSAAMMNAFDNFKEYFDSQLRSIIRSWALVEDQEDIVIFVSGTRNDQVEAAKRLAKQLIQPALLSIIRRNEARRIGMTDAEFVDGVLFPEGLLLAMVEMDKPQKVRLGRKWVVGQDGKIWLLQPARDLTVAEFLRRLHYKASEACRSILLGEPYPPDDALKRCDLGHTIDGDHSATDSHQLTKDDNPVLEKLDKASFMRLGTMRGGHPLITAEENPTAEAIIAAEATDQAKKELSLLLNEATAKERALLTESLRYGGDLVALLRELGYREDAIRQKRLRLKRKVSK